MTIDCHKVDSKRPLPAHRDITDSPWSAVVSNVAVLDFLSAMVTSRGWDVPAHHWDFTTISLCSLLASVRRSARAARSTKRCMLARAALRLWAGVRRFVARVPARSARRPPAAHVADLVREWRDVFGPDTTYSLLHVLLLELEAGGERALESAQACVLGELLECAPLLQWEALASAHKLGALSLERLVRCAADALAAPAQPAHAHLAYRLLLALAKPLVLDDGESPTTYL